MNSVNRPVTVQPTQTRPTPRAVWLSRHREGLLCQLCNWRIDEPCTHPACPGKSDGQGAA